MPISLFSINAPAPSLLLYGTTEGGLIAAVVIKAAVQTTVWNLCWSTCHYTFFVAPISSLLAAAINGALLDTF
jgi:hypothetical protein